MEKPQRNMYIKIGLGIVLVLIIFSFYFKSIENEKKEAFALCLSDNGLEMYGTEWCPYCKKQKAMFGESFMYIDYKDCDRVPNLCKEAGIESYPTWIKGDWRKSGVQSFETLAEITGCKL